MEKAFILLLTSVLFLSLASAVTNDDLHFNIQVTNASGYPLPGTYTFQFNISSNTACTQVLYTNSSNLTTDSRAIISYYLHDLPLNFTDEYYLCYYRDGVLKNAKSIASVPSAFYARNTSWKGIIERPTRLSDFTNDLLSLNATSVNTTTLCLGTDCKTSWPTGAIENANIAYTNQTNKFNSSLGINRLAEDGYALDVNGTFSGIVTISNVENATSTVTLNPAGNYQDTGVYYYIYAYKYAPDISKVYSAVPYFTFVEDYSATKFVVGLSWDAVTGADGYVIIGYNDMTGEYGYSDTYDGSVTTYADNNVWEVELGYEEFVPTITSPYIDYNPIVRFGIDSVAAIFKYVAGVGIRLIVNQIMLGMDGAYMDGGDYPNSRFVFHANQDYNAVAVLFYNRDFRLGGFTWDNNYGGIVYVPAGKQELSIASSADNSLQDFKAKRLLLKADSYVAPFVNSDNSLLQVTSPITIRSTSAVQICNTTMRGKVDYNYTTNHFVGCNGTIWKILDNE